MDWQGCGIGPRGSPAALAELEQRLRDRPDDLVARHNLAVELQDLGQTEAALAAIDAAWAAGLRLPETAAQRGHILIELGQLAAAAESYRAALAIEPAHISALEALAAVLPQLGQVESALDAHAAALQLSPDSVPLWSSALATANGQKRFEQLLDWSETAIARFGPDPVLVGYRACALAGQGTLTAARETIAAALARQPRYATGQVILARIALGLGEAETAARAAQAAIELAPEDQLAWTMLGTAWRLLGDPQEDWLCQYDQSVIELDIDLPAGLADVLLARHRANASPAEQSLRSGTQTAGHLFQTPDPTIIALAQLLHGAIVERLDHLPRDERHPFFGRNSGAIAFSAAWSVKLASQGYHVNHVHPAGWLSSALYVALPPEVGGQSEAGVLQFGQPDTELNLDLPPRLVVTPKTGKLVLFPSYLWHGTSPFQSDQPRLTVAFDAIPVL